MSAEQFDVCVIGGGMAGVSAAAGLAELERVVLLERESHLGTQSTGRSAALFLESYGNALIRALTVASRPFYLAPRATGAFTSPRGALYVGSAEEREQVDELYGMLAAESPLIELIGPEVALRLCPALRPERLAAAVFDPAALDIDVAAVLDHYSRSFRARGGRVLRPAEVHALTPTPGGWHIEAGETRIAARIVVNAAGAWADEIARLAGVTPLGLEPRRRTAVRVAADGWSVKDWPCVADAADTWYFRPDAGALMLSPADETPSAPCDAQPDDYDVAVAIDRVESATQLSFGRPIRAWAGLRTFAADRSPVVGFDPDAPGFFWLAGQGGYGIQTAPALAELALRLIRQESGVRLAAAPEIDPLSLAPARLRPLNR
jgi:D-arginine dehydrogenase